MKKRANYMQNPTKRGGRVVVALGFCLLISACASTPPTSEAITPTISVSYVEGIAPAVAVAATHPQPLLSAELVGPNAAALGKSSAIERDAPARTGSFGLPIDLGVGIFGGSSGGIGTGVGVGVPLGSGASQPPANPNRYRARIPISDLDTYRRDWERTNVRLRFGQASDNVTAEVPAPAPR